MPGLLRPEFRRCVRRLWVLRASSGPSEGQVAGAGVCGADRRDFCHDDCGGNPRLVLNQPNRPPTENGGFFFGVGVG